MKAYKCILPFVALFLVHGASATFGLWKSEKIRDLIENKVNQHYRLFIIHKNPLFSYDYPSFRYYFLKPDSLKNVYFNNNPVGVEYNSHSDIIQQTDQPHVNTFGQDGSIYVFPNINIDNVQSGGMYNGEIIAVENDNIKGEVGSYSGIVGGYENGYIYPAVDNDNAQVDDGSYGGIVGGYENGYIYPAVNSDISQVVVASYGGIVSGYENGYIYPAVNNDNAQVEVESYDGIVGGYGNGYVYPTPNCDYHVHGHICDEIAGEYEQNNSQIDTESNVEVTEGCDCGTAASGDTISEAESNFPTGDVIETGDSTITGEHITHEDNAKPIVEDIDENGFTNPGSDVTGIIEGITSEGSTEPIVEGVDGSQDLGQDIMSEGDTEPVVDDTNENGFVDAQTDGEVDEGNGDEDIYEDAQSDLVYDVTHDDYEKLHKSQTDDFHYDSLRYTGYNNNYAGSEATYDDINEPIKSSNDYFPKIDVRIGDVKNY